MSDSDLLLFGFREMTRSDLQGGTGQYLAIEFDCTIGLFTQRDTFGPAGVVPLLLGDIQIAREDFPPNITFPLGAAITVTHPRGQTRQCTIYSVKDSGPILELLLQDPNNNA